MTTFALNFAPHLTTSVTGFCYGDKFMNFWSGLPIVQTEVLKTLNRTRRPTLSRINLLSVNGIGFLVYAFWIALAV